jgi:hypothetical protein
MSAYHMQWHWNVEIKSVIIAHASEKEHCHEN